MAPRFSLVTVRLAFLQPASRSTSWFSPSLRPIVIGDASGPSREVRFVSKILFVVPPYTYWGVEAIGTWPPLQIAYLAGAVETATSDSRSARKSERLCPASESSASEWARIPATTSSRMYSTVTASEMRSTRPVPCECPCPAWTCMV